MEFTFEGFWKFCQERLKIGEVIPNWSVSGRIRIAKFKIVEITENSIGYDSPNAKNRQNVYKNEFQQIFNVWDDYKKGCIPRNEIREMNKKTTYIIATIKYVEDMIKNNFHTN